MGAVRGEDEHAADRGDCQVAIEPIAFLATKLLVVTASTFRAVFKATIQFCRDKTPVGCAHIASAIQWNRLSSFQRARWALSKKSFVRGVSDAELAWRYATILGRKRAVLY
jgi:hypothetical protein